MVFLSLLFMLTDGNDVVVRNWMDRLKKTGKYDVGPNVLQKLKEEGFLGYFCNDDQTEITVHDTWFAQGYLCDTHTATGWAVAEEYVAATGDTAPMVVLSTASPYKFPAAVLDAIGGDCSGDEFCQMARLEELSSMPEIKFIPKILAINVGNIRIMETEVICFMTLAILLLMMLA